MAKIKPEPRQTDSKYQLKNGEVDYDKFSRDYNKWSADQQQVEVNAATGIDTETTPDAPMGGEYVNGAWVPDDILTGDEINAAPKGGDTLPVTPDPIVPAEPAPASDSNNGTAATPDKDRPWWETAVDTVETATGQQMGGTGEKMPDDWWGEVKNFRYADQKKLNDQYAKGATDTDFRTGVHQARQDRYETYGHGYDWADKDTPDNDHRSAANAAFFEEPSWLDELDEMERTDPQRHAEYMRSNQAADNESALAVLDDWRRQQGKIR